MASYYELKLMIKAGAVKSFDAWFDFINVKDFCKDTGIGYGRLRALRLLPAHMTVAEVARICAITGLDVIEMMVFLKNDELQNMQ